MAIAQVVFASPGYDSSMLFKSFKPKVIQQILVELVDLDAHGDVTQLHKTPLDVIPERPEAA